MRAPLPTVAAAIVSAALFMASTVLQVGLNTATTML